MLIPYDPTAVGTTTAITITTTYAKDDCSRVSQAQPPVTNGRPRCNTHDRRYDRERDDSTELPGWGTRRTYQDIWAHFTILETQENGKSFLKFVS